jgi:hypothetical protein
VEDARASITDHVEGEIHVVAVHLSGGAMFVGPRRRDGDDASHVVLNFWNGSDDPSQRYVLRHARTRPSLALGNAAGRGKRAQLCEADPAHQ